MTQTHRPPPRRLSPQTWTRIREAYMDGVTATELAARHGASKNTIYNRAIREGWSKGALVRRLCRESPGG